VSASRLDARFDWWSKEALDGGMRLQRVPSSTPTLRYLRRASQSPPRCVSALAITSSNVRQPYLRVLVVCAPRNRAWQISLATSQDKFNFRNEGSAFGMSCTKGRGRGEWRAIAISGMPHHACRGRGSCGSSRWRSSPPRSPTGAAWRTSVGRPLVCRAWRWPPRQGRLGCFAWLGLLCYLSRTSGLTRFEQQRTFPQCGATRRARPGSFASQSRAAAAPPNGRNYHRIGPGRKCSKHPSTHSPTLMCLVSTCLK
jgi:hypothetical protein